jgi:hypothetical protein
MPQQYLKRTQIRFPLEHMHGERVAQQMRINAPQYSSAGRIPFDLPPKSVLPKPGPGSR